MLVFSKTIIDRAKQTEIGVSRIGYEIWEQFRKIFTIKIETVKEIEWNGWKFVGIILQYISITLIFQIL